MSHQFNISQSSQSIPYKENINISNNSNQNQNLLPYINISKGKIITLLKTVFSFLNDNSLLKLDPASSFEKYIIDTKLIQTMSKAFYFYTSNDPENGKNALHELIKERYSKFLKFFEQNINYFSNYKELQYRYYLIQGFILLWLIETKYDSQYYDDLIRLINSIIILDNENKNVNLNENINISDKKYLKNFLNTIVKFPFIKQNKDIILKVLEVNECDDVIINYFNENLDNYIQKKNSAFKSEIFNEKAFINIGRKNIKTKNHDSYFPIVQDNSISDKRKSLSNTGSQKGSFTSINSSGFYTPEFKHNKRDSIRHFRRFTMNNINNPKTSFISNKNESYSRANSLSDGMYNLLNKCEEGKHISNSYNNNKNKNGPVSTKSKLRLAIQGHFYTEDDYKNNIDFVNNNNNTSKFSLISEINDNRIDINNIEQNNSNNIIEDDDFYDSENEVESKLVSVDELPINPNMSIVSNSNSKNIGIEPENIIQETKEEEEIDENDQINENNNNNQHNNNYVKILTDNEINDFFNQQFSDNKNNKKNQNIKNNITNNNTNNNNNCENKNKKVIQNKSKKNIFNNSSNNSSRNNSLNNNLFNKNQKNDLLFNKDKEKKNSKKNISFTSNLFKDKNRDKNKNKENNNISVQEKMKNYSNSNVFGIIKNHKNNKKDVIGLKNKNENKILQPCTKGKDLVENALNRHNGNQDISKEKLPTDSVAKKNLLSLYNQLKAKK